MAQITITLDDDALRRAKAIAHYFGQTAEAWIGGRLEVAFLASPKMHEVANWDDDQIQSQARSGISIEDQMELSFLIAYVDLGLTERVDRNRFESLLTRSFRDTVAQQTARAEAHRRGLQLTTRAS